MNSHKQHKQLKRIEVLSLLCFFAAIVWKQIFNTATIGI